MEFLIQSNPLIQFIITSYQGKTQSGWRPLQHGPRSALHSIYTEYVQHVMDVLNTMARAKASQ
jgi:hypothetical protein